MPISSKLRRRRLPGIRPYTIGVHIRGSWGGFLRPLALAVGIAVAVVGDTDLAMGLLAIGRHRQTER